LTDPPGTTRRWLFKSVTVKQGHIHGEDWAEKAVAQWQHPVERSIEPVGFLTYDGHTYRFAYVRNALHVEDFRPLLGFADLHRSYSSTELFPLFAQRAMDPRRPDYHRYVERLGLEGEPGP